MKIIKISDSRRLNLSSIVVGYSQENKIEKIAFEIPDEYKEFGRKACFEGNGTKFAKTFDNVTGNTLTLTRDITQYRNLKMSVAFFKIENDDEIVARTSVIDIIIEDAIVCDDDVKPDEPKIIVLDNLIDEVTKLDVLVTKNEEKREEYYQEIQEKVDNGYFNGATFKPSVDSEGNLSFTNDKGLDNPETVNIRGPKGDIGEKGNSGNDGISVSSIIQTTTSSESVGTNIITATLSDGTTSNFNIMNGAKGDKGDKGEPGTNGTNGIDGQSATITIGTVTTLDAGSNATVENVGTSIDAIFNFGIPKGQAGENAVDSITSTSINSIEVVDSLPETEVEGVLYLVKESIKSDNLWINPIVLTGHYISSSSGKIGIQEIGYTAYIPCESNTTYKITRTMSGYRFTIASYSSVPKEGSTTTNVTNASDLSEVTFVTGASDTYLAIYYFGGSETLDATELLNDIVVIKES